MGHYVITFCLSVSMITTRVNLFIVQVLLERAFVFRAPPAEEYEMMAQETVTPLFLSNSVNVERAS